MCVMFVKELSSGGQNTQERRQRVGTELNHHQQECKLFLMTAHKESKFKKMPKHSLATYCDEMNAELDLAMLNSC